MRPMTVILLRPEYIEDSSSPADTYMAHVWADTGSQAVDLAQKEAAEADRVGIDLDDGSPYDYYPMFVFEGHLQSIGGGY